MKKDTEEALVIAEAKARRRLVELTDKSKMEIAMTAGNFAMHGGLTSTKCHVAIGQLAVSTAKELVANLTAIYVETVGSCLPKDLAVAVITKMVDEFYSGFRSRQQSFFTGLAGHAAKILQKLDEQIAALKASIPEGLTIALFDARRRVGAIESPSTDKREAKNEDGQKLRCYSFCKAGSHWDVTYDGSEVFHIKDSLGVKYLYYLFHHPNEPISAYDLETAIQPEKTDARPKDSIQNDLDARATREYRDALYELQRARKKAEEDDDGATIARLDGELSCGKGVRRAHQAIRKCRIRVYLHPITGTNLAVAFQS
ncbi:MAG: hypothetical protein NTY01_03530 [Verrucomicrobia bacterium]|nr:hypothetical protein [Verrucomicrobiota bacterium]